MGLHPEPMGVLGALAGGGEDGGGEGKAGERRRRRRQREEAEEDVPVEHAEGRGRPAPVLRVARHVAMQFRRGGKGPVQKRLLIISTFLSTPRQMVIFCLSLSRPRRARGQLESTF